MGLIWVNCTHIVHDFCRSFHSNRRKTAPILATLLGMTYIYYISGTEDMCIGDTL